MSLHQLFSCASVHLRFFHIFHGLTNNFVLLLNNIPLSGWTSLLIRSAMEGNLSCSQISVIMNKPGVNIPDSS